MHLSTTFLALLSFTGAALAKNHWENKPGQNHWGHKPNQTWWEPKPTSTAAVVKGNPPPQNHHWEHKPGQTWWGPKPKGAVKPHPHANANQDKIAVPEHEYMPWKHNRTDTGHGTVKHGWGHKPNATIGHHPPHWNGPPPHKKRGSQYGSKSPRGRGYATTRRRSRRNTGGSEALIQSDKDE